MLSTILSNLSGFGSIPNPPPNRLSAWNVKLSKMLGIEARDYLRNADEAATLIPAGWEQETTEIEPGKFVVKLSRDGVTVSSGALTPEIYGLPLAICIAAIQARYWAVGQVTHRQEHIGLTRSPL